MPYAHSTPSLETLRDLSDKELVQKHDDLAENESITDVRYYLDELHRRQQNRHSEDMQDMTETIRNLTMAVTLLTIVNVLAALFA